jgi:hypothetical protein
MCLMIGTGNKIHFMDRLVGSTPILIRDFRFPFTLLRDFSLLWTSSCDHYNIRARLVDDILIQR